MFEVCTPRTNSAPASERNKPKKINIQTPCFRTYSRRAIFLKLCMAIEDVEVIKKVEIIFRSKA